MSRNSFGWTDLNAWMMDRMYRVRTRGGVAVPHLVRLAEGPSCAAAAAADLLAVVDDADVLLGDLTRRDPFVHGRNGGGVHLEDHVVRRRRAVLHRRRARVKQLAQPANARTLVNVQRQTYRRSIGISTIYVIRFR